VLATGLLAAALAAARPAGAAPGPPLEGRRIRHLEVRTRDIFVVPEGRVGGVYSLANHLHVRTRAATVRGALVFREGDRWTEAGRAESERHLRALAFLVPDSIVARPAGEDAVDVTVSVHDNWTTSPEFGIESGGGQHYTSVSFIERNFLGLGTSVAAGYRSDVNGISRLASVDDNDLFGSHWRGRVAFSNGSSGPGQSAALALPFWSDEAPLTLGADADHAKLQSHLYADGSEVAQVSAEETRANLYVGHGRRSGGLVRRTVWSLEVRDRSVSPTRPLAGAPAVFVRPADDVRVRRLAVETRWWKPRYVVRRGVDLIDRNEDFDLGPQLVLKGGFAPVALGSSADEGHASLRAAAGADAGPLGFGGVNLSGSASLRPSPREERLDLAARWVQQPGSRWTTVASFWGGVGRHMPSDFQFTLGGVSGLRAFPVHELTGTEAYRGNAEVRWVGVRDWFQLVSLGGAVFWDAGRTAGPGADEPGWHHDAGFGLRVSLPHSALNAVARFDVAWPISPRPDGRRGAAYSFGSGQAF
jgi:hypothetical protein